MTGADMTTRGILIFGNPERPEGSNMLECSMQVPLIEKLDTMDLRYVYFEKATDTAPLFSLGNLKTVIFSSSAKDAFGGQCPLPADKECKFVE